MFALNPSDGISFYWFHWACSSFRSFVRPSIRTSNLKPKLMFSFSWNHFTCKQFALNLVPNLNLNWKFEARYRIGLLGAEAKKNKKIGQSYLVSNRFFPAWKLHSLFETDIWPIHISIFMSIGPIALAKYYLCKLYWNWSFRLVFLFKGCFLSHSGFSSFIPPAMIKNEQNNKNDRKTNFK